MSCLINLTESKLSTFTDHLQYLCIPKYDFKIIVTFITERWF